MKKITLAIVSACAVLVCLPASGNVINVLGTGDFPAQDISDVTGNPGLGNANVLAWLQAEASANGLPAPSATQSNYAGGPIEAGSFLVLHYGSGRGGTPAGGLVALYFDAAQASYVVPPNGSGPNGFGGISFARLFNGTTQQVPEGGMTLALFGLGLGALGGFARFRKKPELR